jgi:type I restriction enzyme M protein
MTAAAPQIVAKLWNYCSILRDDGLSYGDYVEQLTFLLFLKMADERTRPPFEQKPIIPKEFAWPALVAKDGDALEVQYRHTLDALGKRPGMLGIIFRKAQNKIQDPAKLKRLVADLIDREQWTSLDADVKGDAYEGLLEKNAQDTKGGAGQYFTPRPLIRAIVDCIRPAPGETGIHAESTPGCRWGDCPGAKKSKGPGVLRSPAPIGNTQSTCRAMSVLGVPHASAVVTPFSNEVY